jgi:hypothetical protein
MRATLWKTISRTLIIMLAAALVSGGFYLLVNAGFGQRAQARFTSDDNPQARPLNNGAGIGRPVENPAPGSTLQFGNPFAFQLGARNGISWWAGLTGILRNLGLIALITISVAIAGKLLHWLTTRRPHAPPSSH